MKKILLLSIFSLFASNVEAQMYVSPNSYVYVNDQFVFVNQDVNLAANGNVYLRNQSQLLQGTPTPSTANDVVLFINQEPWPLAPALSAPFV